MVSAVERCKLHRLRLLELSQNVSALHIGGSFSCFEIVDSLYCEVMGPDDTFLLSKGHAGIAQYILLEYLGILDSVHLEQYSTAEGILGVHPTGDIPGIYMATGSLGHGVGLGLGAALAKQSRGGGRVFVVISDGELQEGSTWESFINAPALGAANLTVVVDSNDFQSLGRTSTTHPNMYPIEAKLASFGWNVQSVDGHDSSALTAALRVTDPVRPTFVVAKTTKGKGISYMENEPIWHYRSPNPAEYALAVAEIRGN